MNMTLARLRPSLVVYSAGALQGFSFTLVPSLATAFAAKPYQIGAQAFGALFIPLTLGAIVAAVLTPKLAQRFGMVDVLRFGLAADALGLAALLISIVVPHHVAYVSLLVDASALGLGFGLNISAVAELASRLTANATRSVTIANVLTGLGTALTPLVIAPLVARAEWAVWPSILIAAFVVVFVLSCGWKSAPAAAAPSGAGSKHIPPALVYFALATALYSFCEGAFSSWATTYAHADRALSLATGETALSGFWLALTGTRLVAAFMTRTLSPRTAFASFPIAIALAFLVLPLGRTAPSFVLAFIFAGVACSVVFPYAMSLALGAMPRDEDRVAGVLVAALMTGEGFGTFVIGSVRNAGVSLTTIFQSSAVVALALAIVATLACKASPERAVKSSR